MKQQLAKYKEFIYKLNVETGYFEKQPSKFTHQKLPFELKREPSQCNYLKNRGAKEILQSRQIENKRPFHTGLLPTGSNGVFQGDLMERVRGQKVKSLIIFHFVDDATINVYFFNRLYFDKPQYRLEWCNQFIKYYSNRIATEIKEGAIKHPLS